MNKLYLVLLLALTFVSAYSWYGDSYGAAYRDLYRHNKKSNYAKNSGSVVACSNAVAGFNRGISQLAIDIKHQANQWIIYSDLDALDEVSYYLSHTCEELSLELFIEQSSEQTQVQNKACKRLFTIVSAILEQDETHAFRGGYERGNELSVEALKAGRNLGNGCIIGLRPAEFQQEAENEEEANLTEENGEAENDLNEWSYYIFSANRRNDDSDNESDWESDDDNDSDNNSDNESDDNDSDDSEDDSDNDDSEEESDNSDDDSDDNSDDENDSEDESDDDDSDDNDGNSDDDSDNDDDSDDSDNSNVSWSYNSTQGIRVRVSKESNGQEDDYTISYNPKDGFSMDHSVKNEATEANVDQEANNEEWSPEEWNNEEADNEEWSNDQPLDIKEEIQRQKTYLSFVARYYDQW